MANQFYSADYRRKRKLLVAALIAAPLVLAAGFIAMRLFEKSNSPATLISANAKPRMRVLAAQAEADSAQLPVPNAGAPIVSRKEILDMLAEMQAKPDPDSAPSDGNGETFADHASATVPSTRGEPGVTYIDAFRNCRYSMTVKYQLQGGVDIYVLDTYSGEIRIRTNYIESAPLSLFVPDQLNGQRRFEELVANQSQGGADIYILDTFSGEIQIKSRVMGKKSMRFFAEVAAGGYRRYSCCIFYNSGKLDFYVTDMITGETRIRRGVVSAETISLFSAADRKANGCPHFSCWIELNSGHIDFYSLDGVSGELRKLDRIDEESQLPILGQPSDRGYNRFNGWVNYSAGNIDFYAQDGFSSEIKLFPAIQGKKQLDLFDLPADERAWQRFHSWILFNPGQVEIYTFDRAKGVIKVDKMPSFSGSYRPIAEPDFQPAAQNRYEAAKIPRQQNPGIELYVIDTITSEIRIAKDVSETRTYSMFPDDPPMPE